MSHPAPADSGIAASTRAAKAKLAAPPAGTKRKREPPNVFKPDWTPATAGSKKAVTEAKRASFRDALGKYSTPLLWTWLMMDEPDAAPLNREWDRDFILDQIISPLRWKATCILPELEQLQEVWRAEHIDDPTATPGLYDETWDKAQQALNVGRAAIPWKQRKRAKIDAAGDASVPIDIDAPDDEDDEYDDFEFVLEAKCLSCSTVYPIPPGGGTVASPPIKCPDPLCGMIANRTPNDIVNVRRAQQMAAALGSSSSVSASVAITAPLPTKAAAASPPAPASSSASAAAASPASSSRITPASSATSASVASADISAADFFRTLASNPAGQSDRTHASAFAEAAKAGSPFPRFADTTPIGSRDMVDSIHDRSFNGSAYMRPTDSLLAYIRSGKLVDVGYALPVSVEAREESTRRSSMGGIHALMDGVKMPPVKDLTSMNEYMCALINTILPALIEQPAALSDWLTLTRSMLELDQRAAARGSDGWRTAHGYMQRMLQRYVAQRQSFGRNDLEIVNQLLLDGAFSAAGAARSQGSSIAAPVNAWSSTGSNKHSSSSRNGGAGSGSGKQHSGTGTKRSNDTCNHFNRAHGCHKETCNYTHACEKCKGAHSASACTKAGKTASSKPPAAGAAAAKSD